jgi:hypothetical protein
MMLWVVAMGTYCLIARDLAFDDLEELNVWEYHLLANDGYD